MFANNLFVFCYLHLTSGRSLNVYNFKSINIILYKKLKYGFSGRILGEADCETDVATSTIKGLKTTE